MAYGKGLLFSSWIFMCVCIPIFGETYNKTMSTILSDIFMGYDKKLPPKHDRVGNDRQVRVTVNIFVNSMFSISEANMDYSMSLFLRERWLDERLKYEDTINITRLELDKSLFEDVWMPDMYILNEKASDFHEVTIPNKLIHVYPDGAVQYSARVTGSFSCLMHLQKYPFDKQACHFEVESYGHSTETMKFVWSDGAVSMAENIEFPQFTIAEIKPYSCEKNYYGIVYPCIGVKFILERNYAYYLIQIYVPSILIVILSFVNFWLDCTSVPARISLGLLTVLTMTTQSAGARANLPRVSYVKAIDVYMATCLAFVFLALLEFAYVNVLTRAENRKPSEKEHRGNKDEDDTAETKLSNGSCEQSGKPIQTADVSVSITSKGKRCSCFQRLSGVGRARLVDKVSRVLFPAVFTVFNIIYWIYYFTWNPEFENFDI
ncbi:glycine receptor subunit alpha-2-like [Mercenaria mercenaria]|uniref:glycine receptor subunit alpha-2-like n=1 Tax=Mercenaria mercenaria TaxID=6596 RepID=UPI00234F9AB9|nr:glycine receptor subunit alpha-2-like [Mercenaria mercenaria]XP_045205197.2 glycine receptor subunit alpha-2-like [Mercenaria mercenaria]